MLIDVSHGDKTRLWVRDELNRLSRQTSTFIATPPDGDNTVLGHCAPSYCALLTVTRL
jgi:hypothetical protein